MRDWCFVHPSSHFHYMFLFLFLSTWFLEKLPYTHTRSKTHNTNSCDSFTHSAHVLLCPHLSFFTNSTNYTTLLSIQVCFRFSNKYAWCFFTTFILVSQKNPFLTILQQPYTYFVGLKPTLSSSTHLILTSWCVVIIIFKCRTVLNYPLEGYFECFTHIPVSPDMGILNR